MLRQTVQNSPAFYMSMHKSHNFPYHCKMLVKHYVKWSFFKFNDSVGGRSDTLTRPGHERALRGTGRRETPADNNRESAGVLKAVPEQRPAVRSFPHVRTTRCGNDSKTRPSTPARAAADGAVHRQPPGVPRVKPRWGSFMLRVLVSERFSFAFPYRGT